MVTAREASPPPPREPRRKREDAVQDAEAARLRKELKLLAIALASALLILSCCGVSAAVLGAFLDARAAPSTREPSP